MTIALFPKVISGTGIPILEAKASDSEEDDIGSFLEVTVHPSTVIDLDESVLTKLWVMLDVFSGGLG